ncbi:MAG: glycine rich protein [Clostridia bacterium]|jgi:hypothetical protein|nr:glycine rich protein [Clostridia bacterium]
MKVYKKAGISLIVLVITIIVIIILAGAVILSLVSNNPISSANKAVYLNDLKSFQSELEIYKLNQFSNHKGGYDPTLLQADETSVTYDGVVDTSITIKNLIPSLNRYSGQFQVIDGNLVFVGLDLNKQAWTREVGIEVIIIGEPKITILSPTKTLVAQGEDIVYTVKFSSNVGLTTIDLIDKVELLDNTGTKLPVQPVINIGTLSGISEDATRQVDITIKTDDLINGSYKLRINPGVVTNANNVSNSLDAISLISFTIDNTAPGNPVMSATPTGEWTNGDVTVSIVYSEDTIIKEYSFDSEIWQIYNVPVVVTENNVTVFSRGKDIVGNESGLATLTVANIDKALPTINLINDGTTSSSITLRADAADVGVSGINEASYQYSKDNGLTWTDVTSSTSYTFNGLSTGIYNCKVKVADNVANVAVSDTLQINTQTIGTITLSATPTGWTNGDVTVTINYPTEIVTKQYSIDGTTWNTYSSSIIVTTNNTTVYAKGLDSAGNQALQASLTVSNIDKIVPTVVFETNGASNVVAASTKVTANDIGGSELNTLQYVWDTQNTVVPISSWTSFTNSSDITKTGPGTYYLWVRITDSAGNSIATKSNAFVTVSPIYTFNYTGDYQIYTVSVTGNYKLEAWGASGGNSTRYTTQYGGKGGYTSGTINLAKGQTIYIYVGEAGGPSASNDTTTDNGGWNGGGSLLPGQNAFGAPGGGATDFRTTAGVWSDINSLNSRILVAGGGGGANSRDGDYPSTEPSYYTGYGNGAGGHGGGLVGGDGTTGNQDAFGLNYGYGYGTGATQTSGGVNRRYVNGVLTQSVESGTFGIGGGTSGSNGQAGGGGGWYGGAYSAGHGGGGGGSSYIGGVTNGSTQSGINSGNGKAVITFIGQ